MNSYNACCNCIYWHCKDHCSDCFGKCRRFPPNVLEHGELTHPTTKRLDGCGECVQDTERLKNDKRRWSHETYRQH
jgi:hypothetical protein